MWKKKIKPEHIRVQYPASNQRVKNNNYVRRPWIKNVEIASNLVVFL
jgi:hypothetical protein